jgi:hypothetical protein
MLVLNNHIEADFPFSILLTFFVNICHDCVMANSNKNTNIYEIVILYVLVD